MELRHLRYFAAVAETSHFGRAAERLHMAQPPLSQAIRRLEAELGAVLFSRTTRQVALTRAGEVFQADVRRILTAVDEAAARVGRFASGVEGVLRIGLTGSASYRQLPALARLVKREMPGVAMEVHTEMLTPAQESGLAEGRLDVGVLRPPVRHEGIAHRALADEPLVLAVPQEHWLSEAATVRMDQLRHESFIMYGSALGSVVNDTVVRGCLAAGFQPRCAHEVTETSTALALVAAGLGIALLPDSIRSAPREGVVCKTVADALRVRLVLAWRADDESPLLKNLLENLDKNGMFLADGAEDTAGSGSAGPADHASDIPGGWHEDYRN
ncbi:LysR substrate-binding domain-containing protein [Streptomyces katsurahamanus]|uniref:LysR family transcriptional regulator n=1 Tax=Streptomyces katsurahamanus TaxID=2577098 RepID=A0ABW9P0C1_9ACTN|nr:LysR substrate-binding domain-containing protein [Streptomyces katsurahamanus]MQS38864.1 LysR family transcriptional regulator [Streptomyces katsurahamanus]